MNVERAAAADMRRNKQSCELTIETIRFFHDTKCKKKSQTRRKKKKCRGFCFVRSVCRWLVELIWNFLFCLSFVCRVYTFIAYVCLRCLSCFHTQGSIVKFRCQLVARHAMRTRRIYVIATENGSEKEFPNGTFTYQQWVRRLRYTVVRVRPAPVAAECSN